MMGLVEGRTRGGNGEGSCCTITTVSPFHTWVELAICCCSCFPTSFPHPPLERLFKCFLRRRHARPLVSESSRSVSRSATAVFRLSKVCPFEPLIWGLQKKWKIIAAVMTIKQIIISLMFLSVCEEMAAKTTARKNIQTPAVFTCIFHQFNISR